MKKIFFFAALALSATMMAQESIINWYDQIELQNTAPDFNNSPVGSSVYEEVFTNDNGDIFLVGKSGSAGLDPHSVVLGETIATVPFRPNMAQTNNSPFFAKVNPAGEVQWIVASQDGNFGSYTGLGLEDGSMLVAATSCQTNLNVMGLVQANSTGSASFALAKIYYGFIMKIAADGKPSILARVEQAADDQTNGISFRHIVTDGTNFYVLANLKGKVKIGEDELESAHTGGSLAVLKFNEKGEYQGAVQTSGTAVTAATADLQYDGNKLYITGNVKGVADGTLKIGEASATLTNALSNIAVFVANDDLTGSAVHIINGVKEGNANTITTYATVIADGKIFISGFYKGGIDATGIPAATSFNRAFVAALDLTSGTATGLQLPNADAGITGVQPNGLLLKGDSLYAYYYDYGATGDRVFLQALGKDLSTGSRLPLVNTTGQVSIRGFAFQGKNLIYTIYLAKNFKHTLTANNTIEFNVPVQSGLVVSQKLFSDTATSAPQVRVSADATKQINEGNVYVLQSGSIYTMTGEKVK